MPTTWIVSGDASRARVLQVTGRNELEEIQDFINPRSRQHNREQVADARSAAFDEIDKDLSWLDAKEIDRFLKGNGTSVKYP